MAKTPTDAPHVSSVTNVAFPQDHPADTIVVTAFGFETTITRGGCSRLDAAEKDPPVVPGVSNNDAQAVAIYLLGRLICEVGESRAKAATKRRSATPAGAEEVTRGN